MMKVLNYRDLGSLAEIMPGYFTVPQNPLVKGLAGTACNQRPQLNGLGQTCTDGTAYITNFGCDDGSTPTCPVGYTLSTVSGQYSCVAPGATTLIGSPAPSASATAGMPTGLIIGVIAAAAGILVLTRL